MNHFKVGFIALFIGLFLQGCYTVVYLVADEDEYVEEVVYNPPTHPVSPEPPFRPPYRPPVRPPSINPIVIIHPPIAPPPPEYKTRPPENSGSYRERDDGVVGSIRDKGGRGDNGSRR